MLDDLRYALRMLAKSPGFTAVAALTLALGIGICSAVFGLLNAIVLRDLPYADPGRLVRVWDTNQKRNLTSFPASIPNFLSWRERSKTFAEFAAWRYGSATVGTGAQAERLDVVRISANLLRLLGLKPVAGRAFLEEEDRPGGDKAVLISRRAWKERFGAESAAIGRTLLLDNIPHTIVGVAPEGLESLVRADFWVPLAADPATDARSMHWLRVVGRLNPDAAIAAAQAEMTQLARTLADEFPESNANWSVRLETFRDWIVPASVRTALTVLSGAAACLLLIACANVANLLLMRAMRRQRELALRSALGASRRRLFIQVAIEHGMLAFLGAGLGLGLVYRGFNALRALGPESLPRLNEVAVDSSTLMCAVGLALLTALTTSLISVAPSARLDLQRSLKQGGRDGGPGASRFVLQRGMVSVQLALSMMLMIGALLLTRSFARLLENDLGFRPENLLTFQVAPPAGYSKPESLLYCKRVTESLRALPGAISVGLTSGPPFGPETNRFTTRISARNEPALAPGELLSVEYSYVDSGYFDAIGASLAAGRPFAEADAKQSPQAAILNEAAARRLWPGQSAIGKTIVWGESYTVAGVVRDMRNVRRDLSPSPAIYLFAERQLSPAMTFVVRYEGRLEGLLSAIRNETRRIEPEAPAFNARTMAEMVSGASAQSLFSAWLLAAFAAGALALALVGLYGVSSCAAADRRHEFGVRIALGATSQDLRRLVFHQNAPTLALGLVAGAGASLAGTRILSGLLYGIQPTDSATYAGAGGLLALTSSLAVLIAARRAAKVDPMTALRSE